MTTDPLLRPILAWAKLLQWRDDAERKAFMGHVAAFESHLKVARKTVPRFCAICSHSMPLKQWLIEEAERCHRSRQCIVMRLRRGKYPTLKLHRVNKRVIFVLPTNTATP
jgi:hypothetical protein